NHVGEAHQVALELYGAVPRLKGERRTPHEPEIRLKERGIELVRDAALSEHILRLKLEALNGQDVFFTQTEHRSIHPVPLAEEAGFGRGLYRLVKLKYLLRDRFGFIQRGD